MTCAIILAMLRLQSPDEARGATKDVPSRPFHVAGYLPDYRLSGFDPATLAGLTELIFFSVGVGPAGDLQTARLTAAHLKKLHEIKRRRGVALLLCVGGWERSEGFAKTAASAESRAAFARALSRFCREHQFDGADLDWEHPQTAAEIGDYGLLLKAVKKAFAADRLQLTTAVAEWQTLPAGAADCVDRFHLMAYDAKGRHSTQEFAEKAVGRLRRQGVPAAKISLGLPFYGRGITDGSRAPSYAEISQKYKVGPEIDEVEGLYFNGAKTIEAKTRYARQGGLGGAMVWELGQDVDGERSLLRAVQRGATQK